jgi:hypothetical protein
LTRIPFDTAHDDAAAALKALGPDDVTEAWVGWPPPAESNMTARFDKWWYLLESGGREVTIHFGSLGTVQDVNVRTYRFIMAWP